MADEWIMASKSENLELLRSFLGLAPTNHLDSATFLPPIFISLPSRSSQEPKWLPLTLTILDLLDMKCVPTQTILSSHTFTTDVPIFWTKPPDSSPREMKPVFVTTSLISLPHLLPEKRDLVFISRDVKRDSPHLQSLLHSLGITAEIKVRGILDFEMLAVDVKASVGDTPSILAMRPRLQHSFKNEAEETEFVLRAMISLVLESCKLDVKKKVEVEEAWMIYLSEIGTVDTTWSIGAAREVVERVGKAIKEQVKRTSRR